MADAMIRSIGLLLALLFATAPAWGHATLLRATPPVGGRLATPPAELTLKFNEPIETAFSRIELHDAAGNAVALDKPQYLGGDPSTIAAPLPPLPPGTYTVIWRATSVDTHKTEGRFQFTIAP
jgi:methionine-rich copper-binding protein CopC